MDSTLSEKLKDEVFGGIAVCNDIACKGCLFVEKSPENSYCKIYTGKTGIKPQSVYFFGEPCKYRRTTEDLKKR